ncbi:MAG TPA: nuclear transport factor 2 family protein [Allosphingosinicella sp.]|nr:nuclear transport factor 2 family protein [Allosphingosinicella sp.]
MRQMFLTLLLLVAAAPAVAQDAHERDRAAVLAAAQRLFDALAARDPAAVMAVVVQEGTISGHVTRDGTTRFFADRWQDWANGLREGSERLEERMHNPRVRIRGNMASIWTEYSFYRDGRFSHCGIDLFDMAKVEGRWRVLNITFTVETQGCRRR